MTAQGPTADEKADRLPLDQIAGIGVSRISQRNYEPENKGLFCCISPLHNDTMKYGYARVSPGGKSESVDAQARQLTKAGCKMTLPPECPHL